MTCKDCVHYEVCQYHIDEETKMTVAECGRYINKADYVEVVRCKDCEHYRRDINGIKYCVKSDLTAAENFYCKNGRKRIEMKPCPICGNKNVSCTVVKKELQDGSILYKGTIVCLCGLSFIKMWDSDTKHIIYAWNERKGE